MNDNNDHPAPSNDLIQFPCDFTLKVFGLSSPEFHAEVLRIMHAHITNLPEDAITSRPSANGKYTSLNITVHAESKAQLDSIYQELSSSPIVLMAL